jgi:hypothetical protein
MLPAQGDSRSPETERPGAQGERRFSWGMILVGAALLLLALFLFYYARSNTPETVKGNVDNRPDLTPPANATGNAQTTPSPAAPARPSNRR